MIETYKRLTAEFFELDVNLIFSRSREVEYLTPRRFLIYYLRQNYHLGLKAIGKLISNYDHSTILNHLTKHEDYLQTEKKYANAYNEFREKLQVRNDLFANNADLSNLIDYFENATFDINNETINEFKNYYFELREILIERDFVEIEIFAEIRKLLLTTKVDEYTLNDNRLYSFIAIKNIVVNDFRTSYLYSILTSGQIIELGFVILQAKHIASINKIRLELNDTSTELILEKYIDCLNYYILYKLFRDRI